MWLDSQFWESPTNSLKEIKTLIQKKTFIKSLIQRFINPLQATGFEKRKYTLNGAHFKQQSKHCSYTWNTKKYGRKSLYTDIENFQISVCYQS